MQENRNRSFKTSLVFIFLLILGSAVYSNTLTADFQFDDGVIFADNPSIRDIRNIHAIWHSFNTRFIPGLTFAINYYFGQLNVIGYHLVNIIIHICTSFFVYIFIGQTLKIAPFKKPAISQNADLLAFLASLIFLVHPIQTEAVTYISQRSACLAALFYMATLVLYIKARLESKTRFLIEAFLTSFLAMFSKEFSITLPVTLLLYEMFFLTQKNVSIKKKLLPLVPFLVAPLIVVFVFLQGGSDTAYKLDTQLTLSNFKINNLLTEINALRTYLRLLVFPVNQNLDYDYPLSTGFFEPSTLLSVVLLLAIFFLGIFLFKRERVASFFIFWYFVTLSVETVVSSIVAKDMIFEHYLYLPMVGFSILLPLALAYLLKKKNTIVIAVGIVIMAFSVATFQRNEVWRNHITLWTDVIHKSPLKLRSNCNLSSGYIEKRQYEKALVYANRAHAIDPNYYRPYFHLASIYSGKGMFEKALEYALKAHELKPLAPYSVHMTGYLYAKLKKYDLAFQYYEEFLNLVPTEANVINHYKLLLAYYFETGDREGVLKRADFLRNFHFPKMTDRILKDLRDIVNR